MLVLVITALGLGVAYSAAPGAVNTEAIRRGTAHGAHTTLLVEFGALIGDSFWAILGLTGVTLLAHFLPLQIVLGISGGFFLLRMAWFALHEVWTQHKQQTSPVSAKHGDFMTGAVFGLANPVGLAFWSGVGSSVVAQGVTGIRFVLFFFGFFLGAVIWSIGISILIHFGRRWIRPTMFRWINLLCGLALGYFGLRILWTTARACIETYIVPNLKPAR
jgi:threonine/homoserine/homoserine lactone efflux protein